MKLIRNTIELEQRALRYLLEFVENYIIHFIAFHFQQGMFFISWFEYFGSLFHDDFCICM